eukprot:CAMPEP_0183744422 /NCGR_PEP_ID=MMETSP0737-20130205/65723_1 /TAXON_ID=385413 /ORGANISM="Thalassiosira miniscula, Strain CCMP1093" /LENGTH=144 /DNA_ID=CAMNT_0025980063 /DNA_START=187 /DNA_END=621 /DNA_ORIENTATION=-
MAKSSSNGIKQEHGSSSSGSNASRIQQLEEETKVLKERIALQEEQILNVMMTSRNNNNYTTTKESSSTQTPIFPIVLILLVIVLYAIYQSIPSDDTILYINVKATPVKTPWITAGVKVQMTMGDLVACAKSAFTGDTVDLQALS